MKKRFNVTGAVVVHDNKVLAARRGEGKSLAGYWEFPGGKIEAGESPHDALAREMREELHCDVKVGEEVTTTEHEYDFATIVLTTFYCTSESGEMTLTEHAEIRWVEPSELDQLQWAPADVPAVKLVMDHLS